MNESAYVVHWSGSRKPHTLRPQQTLDDIEKEAHADFMRARCELWAAHFADADLPHFQKQCGAIVTNLPPDSPLSPLASGSVAAAQKKIDEYRARHGGARRFVSAGGR